MDFTQTTRDSAEYYTAGPFEAPKELIPPSPKPPAKILAPVCLALPEDKLKDLPNTGDLAQLAAALKELPVHKNSSGKTVTSLVGLPFEINVGQAIILDPKHAQIRLPIKKGLTKLYLLYAVVNPAPTGLVDMCKILREDGAGVGLTWETGKNIASSIGEWTGQLSPETGDRKTEIVWEAKSKKARLFLTTWNNENFWYPIRDLEWTVMDGQATIVILGLTVQPDK
jgi:hypothetical protein